MKKKQSCLETPGGLKKNRGIRKLTIGGKKIKTKRKNATAETFIKSNGGGTLGRKN